MEKNEKNCWDCSPPLTLSCLLNIIAKSWNFMIRTCRWKNRFIKKGFGNNNISKIVFIFPHRIAAAYPSFIAIKLTSKRSNYCLKILDSHFIALFQKSRSTCQLSCFKLKRFYWAQNSNTHIICDKWQYKTKKQMLESPDFNLFSEINKCFPITNHYW